eukprot:GHUV01026101.1.p1 GENE.GHUV01026101.1~~GHUV01026101.1.p1  ORF type:complete len:270 (+),score=74.80 GHUV01026101.1:140-949(+)
MSCSVMARTIRCSLDRNQHLTQDSTGHSMYARGLSSFVVLAVYMTGKLGIPQQEVQELARQLYHGYGTTMAGLMAAGYQVDVDDWHAAVHDTLAYEQLLQEDPQLLDVLARLTLQKHVLTNADARHAVKVFKQLGVTDCFQNVFCYENVQELGRQAGLISQQRPVLCKPSKHVYQLVMEQVGAKPHNTIFIDDSPRNISAAHELGIFTVLVSDNPGGPPGHPHHAPGADLVVSHFRELPSVLPRIFSSTTLEEPHEDVLSAVPIRVMAS